MTFKQKRKSPWIVGLTGGIASGKSTVTAYLLEKGIPVVDADSISHQLMIDDTAIKLALMEHYGLDVLRPDGQIDRQEVGKRIYASTHERQWLNHLMHPKIRERMQEEIGQCAAKGAKLVVLDVPLLYEAHFDDLVDEVLVVAVPTALQLQRLMERDHISRELAEQKVASQLSLAEKKARADRIIDNAQTIHETHVQVDAWLKEREEIYAVS